MSANPLPTTPADDEQFRTLKADLHRQLVAGLDLAALGRVPTPELRQDMTVHLVSSIDEVLAMALQPVSSDLRPGRKDSKDAKEPKSGARIAARP